MPSGVCDWSRPPLPRTSLAATHHPNVSRNHQEIGRQAMDGERTRSPGRLTKWPCFGNVALPLRICRRAWRGWEIAKVFFDPKNEKAATEKCLALHFPGIQRSWDGGGLDIFYWLPAPEKPAERLTKVESDTVPLLRLVQSGSTCPGALRPPRGAAFVEGPSA